MKWLIILWITLPLLLWQCTKDEVDKKAQLMAEIQGSSFDINNATARVENSNWVPGKKQLSITGADQQYRLSLFIYEYLNDTGAFPMNAKALAILENKSTGKLDTSNLGLIRLNFVQLFNQVIPGQPFSSNAYAEYYKAELIVGTFDIVTRQNIQVSSGLFSITFNK